MTGPSHPGLRDLREVGRGAFGVVYRARQEVLDRDVAIKLLTTRPQQQARSRFAQECRALGQLSGHPHIVEVHDGGVRADDQAFLVMPFYAHGSLAKRLKDSGPVPWLEVADFGVRLSGALQTAHDAGILHRDLKPANILLDEYAAPRLGDFGQARLADAEITSTGELAITPAFAAPEVLNGAAATAQSDVYSLAATLTALLLGHPPFETGGDLVAMVYRVVSQPPPDLRAIGVPTEVAGVLERAMAKDPGRRFETAAHFGTAMQAAQRRLGLAESPLTVAGRPVSALPPVETVATDPSLRAASAPAPRRSWRPPPVPPIQARPPVRRRQWVLVAGILATLLVLGGGTVAALGLLDAAGRGGRGASATPAPTGAPAPARAAVGVADVTAVADDPAAQDVGDTLSAYFTGVNSRNLDQAYGVFSPALRDRIGFDGWSAGLVTTRDSAVVVSGIDRPDAATLEARASFTSRQAADDGPAPGETCSNWTLVYTLVPSVDGATPFQIDAVRDIGPGHTAC